MTIFAIMLVLAAIFMFYYYAKGDSKEYNSSKEFFKALCFGFVQYYYKGTPTRVVMYALQGIMIIYTSAAIGYPLATAIINYDAEHQFYSILLQCQWNDFSSRLTYIFLGAIVLIVVAYLFTSNYETKAMKKILANTDETNDGIKELKEQGNTILQAIQTQQKHPACTVSFLADGKCTDQITIHPVYRQIHYVPKPKQAIGPTIRPRCVSPDMVLGISGLMEAVNNARVQLGVSKQESALRANNGQIDHTLCPVQFVIRNTGDSALDNVIMSVRAKDVEIRWENSNKTDTLIDLFYLEKLNYFIKNGKVLQSNVNQLNAGDAYLVSVVYLNVPRTESQVELEWELSSWQHKQHQTGRLIVQVQPEYKVNQVVNDNMVGKEDAYDAYIELF